MNDKPTVIDMQDPNQRKWAQLAILKSHLKLFSKGMRHTTLTMDGLLTALEKHLHEGKRVYARSRKGCEQAVERIVMWQEEVTQGVHRTLGDELAHKLGAPS